MSAALPSPVPLPAVGALPPSALLADLVDHYWFSQAANAPVTVLLPDGRVDVVLERTGTRTSVAAYGSVTARTTLTLMPGACYVGNGGQESECGWCKDRWGVNWQITPRTLTDAIAAGGEEAKRAFDVMMTMRKIDVAAIDAARRG